MSKGKIALVVVGGLFVIGAISSALTPAKSGTGTTATTSAPAITKVTTTSPSTSDDSAIKATCESSATTIAGLWGQYADTLTQASSSGLAGAVASAAAATGHQLVSTSNTWVSNCAAYYPVQAESIRSQIAEVEPLIDSLG